MEGVGFRNCVRLWARDLGLRGWAINLTDGWAPVTLKGRELAERLTPPHQLAGLDPLRQVYPRLLVAAAGP